MKEWKKRGSEYRRRQQMYKKEILNEIWRKPAAGWWRQLYDAPKTFFRGKLRSLEIHVVMHDLQANSPWESRKEWATVVTVMSGVRKLSWFMEWAIVIILMSAVHKLSWFTDRATVVTAMSTFTIFPIHGSSYSSYCHVSGWQISLFHGPSYSSTAISAFRSLFWFTYRATAFTAVSAFTVFLDSWIELQ